MVTYFFPKIHVAFCENVASKLRINKDLKQVGPHGFLMFSGQILRGSYTWMSYGDAQFEVLRISSGLHRKFGLATRSHVGLLGDASAEWLLCDLACMRLGVNTVCLAAPATHPTTGTTAPVPGGL